MRFFTPDVIARGQTDDERALNEHEELWEELGERYRAYLATVRHSLPSGLRHILDSYYLHDAKVGGMGVRDGAFVIVLELDTPPWSLLTFTYDLVSGPQIDRDAL